MDYSDLRHLMAAVLLAPKLKDKTTTLDPEKEWTEEELELLSSKTLPEIHGVYQIVDTMLEMDDDDDDYEDDEDYEEEEAG